MTNIYICTNSYKFYPLLGHLQIFHPKSFAKTESLTHGVEAFAKKGATAISTQRIPRLIFEWVKGCRRWVINGLSHKLLLRGCFHSLKGGWKTQPRMPQAPMLAVFSSHVKANTWMNYSSPHFGYTMILPREVSMERGYLKKMRWFHLVIKSFHLDTFNQYL